MQDKKSTVLKQQKFDSDDDLDFSDLKALAQRCEQIREADEATMVAEQNNRSTLTQDVVILFLALYLSGFNSYKHHEVRAASFRLALNGLLLFGVCKCLQSCINAEFFAEKMMFLTIASLIFVGIVRRNVFLGNINTVCDKVYNGGDRLWKTFSETRDHHGPSENQIKHN